MFECSSATYFDVRSITACGTCDEAALSRYTSGFPFTSRASTGKSFLTLSTSQLLIVFTAVIDITPLVQRFAVETFFDFTGSGTAAPFALLFRCSRAMNSVNALSIVAARRFFSPAISSICFKMDSSIIKDSLTLIVLNFQFHVEPIEHGFVQFEFDLLDTHLVDDLLDEPIREQVSSQHLGQATGEQVKQLLLLQLPHGRPVRAFHVIVEDLELRLRVHSSIVR